jgi:hypothetical protein
MDLTLVKVFRLFRFGMDFFGILECGHSRLMYNILSIGRASVFVMPCFDVLRVKEGTFM